MAGTAVSLQRRFYRCRPVVFLLQGNKFVALSGNNFDNSHEFLFEKKKKLGLAFGSKPGDRVMTADMFSQFLPNKLLHKFAVFHPDGCHSNPEETKTHSFPLGSAVHQLGRCIHGRSGRLSDLKVTVIHSGHLRSLHESVGEEAASAAS